MRNVANGGRTEGSSGEELETRKPTEISVGFFCARVWVCLEWSAHEGADPARILPKLGVPLSLAGSVCPRWRRNVAELGETEREICHRVKCIRGESM